MTQWYKGDPIIAANLNRKTEAIARGMMRRNAGGQTPDINQTFMGRNTTASVMQGKRLYQIAFEPVDLEDNEIVKYFDLADVVDPLLYRPAIPVFDLDPGEIGPVVISGPTEVAVEIVDTGDWIGVGTRYADVTSGNNYFSSVRYNTGWAIYSIGEEITTGIYNCVVNIQQDPQTVTVARFRQNNSQELPANGAYTSWLENMQGYKLLPVKIRVQAATAGTFSMNLRCNNWGMTKYSTEIDETDVGSTVNILTTDFEDYSGMSNGLIHEERHLSFIMTSSSSGTLGLDLGVICYPCPV